MLVPKSLLIRGFTCAWEWCGRQERMLVIRDNLGGHAPSYHPTPDDATRALETLVAALVPVARAKVAPTARKRRRLRYTVAQRRARAEERVRVVWLMEVLERVRNIFRRDGTPEPQNFARLMNSSPKEADYWRPNDPTWAQDYEEDLIDWWRGFQP